MKKRNPELLIRKLIENKLSKEELEDFLDGLGDTGTEEKYTGYLKAYFDDLIEETVLHPVNPEIAEEVSAITEESKPVVKKSISKRWINFYRWAAAIALVISFFYLFQFMSKEPLVRKPTVDAAPAFVEKVARRGSKLRLNLNDGSFIHLNADSKMIIPNKFNRRERHVDLSGEAYFRVSRDEQRPFTIGVRNVTVEVLGTSFNVRAYEDEEEISVTVESGKVLVKLEKAGDNGSVLLLRGQKLIFNPSTGAIKKFETDPYFDICWTRGILYFNKTRLVEVERILERWYAVEIDVASPQIYKYRLTGEHHNKNLKSVLEALKFALKIDYKIKGNHVTLKL